MFDQECQVYTFLTNHGSQLARGGYRWNLMEANGYSFESLSLSLSRIVPRSYPFLSPLESRSYRFDRRTSVPLPIPPPAVKVSLSVRCIRGEVVTNGGVYRFVRSNSIPFEGCLTNEGSSSCVIHEYDEDRANIFCEKSFFPSLFFFFF